MTVRELKSQLSKFSDDTTIVVETSSGRHEITKAASQGDYLAIWTDNS